MGNPSVMGVLSQPPVSRRGGFCSPQPQHACPPGRGPWERRPAALKLGLLSRVIGAIFPFYGHFWRAGSSRQTLSPAITVQMRSVPVAGGGLPPRAPRTKRPGPAPRSARPRRSQPCPSAGGVPGRTTGNNGGLGRGRDRQVRPPPRSALTSSPPPQRPPLRQGPGARLAARAGRHRAVRTRGHAPAPPRPPRGAGRWVQLRPCAPRAACKPPRCRLWLAGDSGRGQGPGLHAALQARREHARTKARGPQTGKVRGGLGAYACRTKGVAATHVGIPGSGRRHSEGQHGMF